ncbi:hypothetical protein [Trujillonella endophytica]|uniref:SbsA Ig-like domain-containing protein n=1 Tax=Trujillonella endophytica TaxID=673521 RepID=A0A1H8R1C7_9ACTN|nr:hypothetical protein [Trujillella endophytica]SEO60166.1 hypothetical protein SAMN05660991_00936 [Trujillella endophytica]
MEVGWEERRGDVVLVVRGLPAGAAARVYPADVLGDDRTAPRQPMAGRWEAAGTGAVFAPRFPFLPGTEYAVLAGDGEPAVLRRPPAPGPRQATVVAVEPALDVVPRNLLRFSVRFSHPMSEGWALRAVRLERVADGAVVPGAFLDADPELWDADRRRLTLLLDPARLKRGLAPHREAGYPLVEGDEVRLVVDEDFRDAGGRGLLGPAAATFRVGPDLRGRVRPDAWTVSAPPAGTRAPLRIRFDRPLDRSLADRCLRVADRPGAGTTAPDGRGWSFVPDRPWTPGPVPIAVDPALEDVAGNSVARVFDRDLTVASDDPLDPADAVVLTAPVAAGDSYAARHER